MRTTSDSRDLPIYSAEQLSSSCAGENPVAETQVDQTGARSAPLQDSPQRINRPSIKALLHGAIFLAAAGVFCWALAFVLVPYGSKSAIMWHDLRQVGQLDTVYLGTSLVGRSVDPNLIDERLGTESFNMATPSQTLEDSYLGIEDAIKNHGVKRVVLGVEYAGLVSKADTKAGVFVTEKAKGESLPEALRDLSIAIDAQTWLGDPAAISILLFPWQIQHVDSLSEAVQNVQMKLGGASIYEAGALDEAGWTYYGKGFGSTSSVNSYAFGPDYYYINYYEIAGADSFNPDRMAVLERICGLCADNGVELVLVTTPLSDAQIVSFGEQYGRFAEQLRAFADEHGAKFFDINLARPELFADSNAYYHDFQHMNYAGSQAFSEALAKLLAGIDAGAPVDDWFGSYADRIALVTQLASAGFESITAGEDAVRAVAASTIGPNAQVEYRFSVAPAGSKDFQVVQDFSTSKELTYTPPERGTYQVKVEARTAGNEKPEIAATRNFIF